MGLRALPLADPAPDRPVGGVVAPPESRSGLLDALGEAVAVLDAGGRIVTVNAAACELLGATADELTGRSVGDPWWHAVREDGSEFPIEEFPGLVTLRTGEPAENVVMGIRRAGQQPVWLLVTARSVPGPVLADAGQIVVSARDVTEWRADQDKAAGLARFYAIRATTGRAIARVGDRRDLLQAVCEAALAEGHLTMAWIGFTDASGRVRPAAWAGVERGYLDRVWVSVDEAVPEGGGPTGRAARTGAVALSDDVATDAAMQPWRDEALRLGFRSSAAFPLIVEGAVVGAFSVYAEAPGAFTDEEVALLAGVAEDLSFALDAQEAAARERAAQERLRASEARFRELLESAPDAVVIVGATGEILLVNRQTEVMFGADRSDLIGQPVEVLIPRRLRTAHEGHRAAFFHDHPVARPMGTDLDLSGRRWDGSEFPVEISLSPLLTDEGLWVSAAIRDITERKEAEAVVLSALERERELTERLREVDRIKDDFVSTVSHELRTPLTSIMGSIDVLSDPDLGEMSPVQRRFFDILDRNSHRLHDLIEDLLQLNQIEAGGIALQPEPTDLLDMVERVRALVATMAESQGVTLCIEATAGLGRAAVDSRQLGRALENLLTNAIKFSPGGTVKIAARRTEEQFQLVVTDDGMGIPEQEQQQLFTPFFRSSAASERAIPGTGLGLVIVKRIVDAHQGTIKVESALGVGTTVSVSVPLVPPAPLGSAGHG